MKEAPSTLQWFTISAILISVDSAIKISSVGHCYSALNNSNSSDCDTNQWSHPNINLEETRSNLQHEFQALQVYFDPFVGNMPNPSCRKQLEYWSEALGNASLWAVQSKQGYELI